MDGIKVELIVLDDNLVDREIASLVCAMVGVSCITVSNYTEFMQNFMKCNGAIIDYTLRNELTGVDVAKLVLREVPDFPIIFRSQHQPGSEPYSEMSQIGEVISKSAGPESIEILQNFVNEIRKEKT